MPETDLYAPVKDYFVERGYDVYAEVKHADVVASKHDELIIVELKTQFTLALLSQAAERQRAADFVYVAVPRPKERLNSKRWKGYLHLLRRLELGLIFVTLRDGMHAVQVVQHPAPYTKRKQLRLRQSIEQELSGRTGDRNVGGSTKRSLVTAYRENAVHIACCLERFGPLSAKQLRSIGTGMKTLDILYQNYYGWFERRARGVYQLTPTAVQDLERYEDLAVHYRAQVQGCQMP